MKRWLRPLWILSKIRFDPADRFLHRTMQELVRGLEAFLEPTEGALADVDQRLDWARRVDDLTRNHPRAYVTWAAAADAIRQVG